MEERMHTQKRGNEGLTQGKQGNESLTQGKRGYEGLAQGKRGYDSFAQGKRGIEILAQAQAYYRAMDKFRRQRERCKRYTYGDQWHDVVDVDGRRMTEERYIREQGNIPLKNNLIRRLVRNVIGVYSSQSNEPVCVARDPEESAGAQTLTRLLRYNMQLNRVQALYARSMEEFLISGMIVHRKWVGTRGGRTDCWTDYVQPNNFFIDNRARDFRLWDVSCVGEIHDLSFGALCSKFAVDVASQRRLERIYGIAADPAAVADAWLEFGQPDRSFLMPAGAGLCRVVEVWRKETRRVYHHHDRAAGVLHTGGNAAALAGGGTWTTREVWHYYYIAPTGDILAEGDSPYNHGEHPYVIKAYPLIDGEIHSFVSDVIDQQRYTNRLITLYDCIMRSSAKGVLLVPEDCVPRGTRLQDFADTWARYNGVIYYRPSANGEVPKQISANSTDIGIRQLLEIQLKFFEDISGVNNALLGKTGNVAISADLYGQQTQNATTTLLDVLDTFTEFVRDASYKDVKNIQQYYDPGRVRAIAGADAATDEIGDIDFDLSIAPSTSTPASRSRSNEMLLEIWRSGQISLEQLLRVGSFPFADELLSSISNSE